MAQRTRGSRGHAVLHRSRGGAAGRRSALLATAGADRHRPARGRRAAAELPPTGRVGGRQRQHRSGRLRGPRGERPGGQPPGPGDLCRRRNRGRARSSRRSPAMRCGGCARRGSIRPTWSIVADACASMAGGRGRRRAAPGPSRPRQGERGDRGAPRAAPPDRAGLRSSSPPTPATCRTSMPTATPLLEGPRRRRRGAGADARHADRSALRGAARRRAAGQASRRGAGAARSPARRGGRRRVARSGGGPLGRAMSWWQAKS